jgi:hypothetical protein
MQIDGKVLLSYLGTSNLASLGLDTKQHRANLIFIARRFYCTPMTVSGNCPQQCCACKVTIVTQFDHFRREHAKNPAALWTWLMRQAVADVLERGQQKAAERAHARAVDHFGTQEPSNVFEALLEEMDT